MTGEQSEASFDLLMELSHSMKSDQLCGPLLLSCTHPCKFTCICEIMFKLCLSIDFNILNYLLSQVP